MTTLSLIKINVYKSEGKWFGARWIDCEYDGCDALELADDASDAEAIAHAQLMTLSVQGMRTVLRVSDTGHTIEAWPRRSRSARRTRR